MVETAAPIFETRNLNVHYGDVQALKDICLPVAAREITALIGPSGCGKSTFLRGLNRMNDTIIGCRTSGDVLLHGKSINGKDVDVVELRARVGMVFQKANPFPKSIYDNVAYGPRLHGMAKNRALWMTLWNKAWVTPVFGRSQRKTAHPRHAIIRRSTTTLVYRPQPLPCAPK